MTAEWQEVRLGDVAADITVGYVSSMTHEYRDSGVPFLRSQDVKPHRIEPVDLKFISPEFHQRILKSALRPGDVVVVRTGVPGTAAVIPESLPQANCADLVVIRPGPRIAARFLAYFFNSQAGKHHVRAHTVGAVQQHFNVGAAREARIRLPGIDEQRAIAEVLGALDDKIELNRRMSDTMEAVARAIFRSWFVDFDPVRAKATGRPPPGMDAATAALFPNGFEESELGKVPREWRTVGIYDLATVTYGAPFASSHFNGNGLGLPLLRIRDLATHQPEVFTSECHRAGTKVAPGNIVVGMDGEFRVHAWRGPVSWLNQRVCMFSPREGVPRTFLRLSLEKPLAFFERAKVGTTVIHLGKSDIDTFRVLAPPKPVLERYAAMTHSLAELNQCNSEESRTLAALRDALLPKLLSGELRVRDAERAVEKVA